MTEQPELPAGVAKLCGFAAGHRTDQRPSAWNLRPEFDGLKSRHELEIRVIELEMQNAELRHANQELETALRRYVDFYDFAALASILGV